MVALSVLLLTKNGSRDLVHLLPAVFQQRGIGPFEVVVVDSGSTDGTISLVQKFPVRLQQISPEAFHHARTRNLAATLAAGDILVFLSQDAIPASDLWLNKLIANFDDPKVGAVYGRQIPKEAAFSERKDTLDIVYGSQKFVKDPAHRNGLGYRFYHFSDVNAAIRRNVWRATPFPEELKVFEDLGIAKRMLDAGWKIVYEPEAAVLHSHNYRTKGLFQRYFDIGCTLKQLEIWDAHGTKKSLWRDALKMFSKTLRHTRNPSEERPLLQALRQDVAKSVGLFLGLHEAYLPVALKRHLSAFQLFG